MPKAPSPTGSFSDLYDAMQQRGPTQRATNPSVEDRTTPSPNPQPAKRSEENKRGKEGKREGGKEGDLPLGREGGKPPEPFDINERPYRKGSFMLTNEEFWSLDEIKLDLQKRFDLAATKDDLARCAFRQLLADYKSQGESSILIRILRNKTRR